MSKYEVKDGIVKTPVFHGSNMFFIRRENIHGYINVPSWRLETLSKQDHPCTPNCKLELIQRN